MMILLVVVILEIYYLITFKQYISVTVSSS